MKRGDSIFQDFGDNLTIFDNLAPETLSRADDPPTSKKAVNIPRIKGELKTVLNAVDQMVTGFTARELSNHSSLDYIMISKRLSVLKRYGFVTKSEKSDPNPEIRDGQMVWRRTP